MQFLIADTFTDSLARLTGGEQKLVKTTAFDLQVNPENPGMQFHRLDKAKDKSFWSIRVGSNIRIIVHRTQDSILLCYVDHHDRAYRWAERRKLETHPKTGAAQLVEIRERVEEIVVARAIEREVRTAPKGPILAGVSDEQLLSYGVPAEWLGDVRAADEDTLLQVADHLPAEAAEAVLDLAVGVTPQPVRPVASSIDPFAHPDAQRRFRMMSNVEELERALAYPWDKWTIFLHPAQRELVERNYEGPARVSGSAGTGKTIVALHRAVFLTRMDPNARVLLTTFSEPLANALRARMKRLISNEPRIAERLDVYSLDAIGLRLFEAHFERPRIADRLTIHDFLKAASSAVEGHKFSLHFLITEWEQIVDTWQLDTWEAYRDVRRLGRKTRLPEKQRVVLWAIFEQVKSKLAAQGMVTMAAMYMKLASHLSVEGRLPYEYIVVDEVQDISISQLRFCAALEGGRPNSLFFAGDLGQRIFRQPFSWKAIGVDVRGRSRTLKINYRTSHQIRMQADRLLGPELSDVDGNVEDRRGTVSVFNGPKPEIVIFKDKDAESEAVGLWLKERIDKGIAPHEIGIFVRSAAEIDRAQAAMKAAGIPYKVLDDYIETVTGYASIGTMHLAKGLEFRVVAVMACDDEIIPSQKRIESVADDADLEEVYNTERHLLYVACTRARDYLLVTSGNTHQSEFLDDLKI